jgi:hypothetical protein
MVADWHDKFEQWARPPSSSEQQKCGHSENAIRDAASGVSAFQDHNISVFTQGSYKNRTNVRQDSDVDICVFTPDTFFFEGTTAGDAGIVPPSYEYAEFKNQVGTALVDYFGSSAVRRGTKAFDVDENTYRLHADVIACFEYRLYSSPRKYISGTAFIPDGTARVIFNWPQQNYDSGVVKNEATNRGFKAVVRVLKSLRYAMQDAGIAAAKPVPSFLVECLVSNVPDSQFEFDLLANNVRNVLADIWNRTGDGFIYKDWLETNGIKYLFHGAQPWTREQARDFILSAWNFIGFE